MIQNLRQGFEAARRGPSAISSTRLAGGSPGRAAEFSDREIELYMLPHPANPSPSLQQLYTAIRHQMVLDGCR